MNAQIKYLIIITEKLTPLRRKPSQKIVSMCHIQHSHFVANCSEEIIFPQRKTIVIIKSSLAVFTLCILEFSRLSKHEMANIT